MPDPRWITIANWQRFQHYGLARRPTWIKNYIGLLHKDEYLDLPLAARGLLHGIWLAYADRNGRLREGDLPSILLGRARDAHLTSLNDAGLIGFSASRPLPLTLEESDARVRAKDITDRQRQKAQNWIRNGAANGVPIESLTGVIADEFHLDDPAIVDQLVAQAQEWRPM